MSRMDVGLGMKSGRRECNQDGEGVEGDASRSASSEQRNESHRGTVRVGKIKIYFYEAGKDFNEN